MLGDLLSLTLISYYYWILANMDKSIIITSCFVWMQVIGLAVMIPQTKIITITSHVSYILYMSYPS